MLLFQKMIVARVLTTFWCASLFGGTANAYEPALPPGTVVTSAVVSNNGTLLAVGTKNEGVFVYRIGATEPLATIAPATNVWALQFTPDNNRLVSAENLLQGGSVLRLWNVHDAKEIAAQNVPTVWELVAGPDGNEMLVVTDAGLLICELQGLGKLASIDEANGYIPCRAAAYLKNGQRIITAIRPRGTHRDEVNDEVVIIDRNTLGVQDTINVQIGSVRGICTSRNGGRVAVLGQDGVEVLDTFLWQSTGIGFVHKELIARNLSFLDDERYVFASSYGDVHILDVPSGQFMVTASALPESFMRLSSDCEKLICHDLDRVVVRAVEDVRFRPPQTALQVLQSRRVPIEQHKSGYDVSLRSCREYDLVWLPYIENLQVLSIQCPRIELREIRHLTELPKLEYLRVEVYRQTEIPWLVALRDIPALRKVALHGPQVQSIAGIEELRQIEELRLGADKLPSREFHRIAGLSDLRVLDLGGQNIMDAQLAGLSFPKLELLNLQGTDVTDVGMVAIANWTALRELILADTQITTEGITAISDLRNLEVLVLENTAVTDDGFECITKLKSLKILLLSATMISERSFDTLRQMESLKELRLPATFPDLQFAQLRMELEACEVSRGRRVTPKR